MKVKLVFILFVFLAFYNCKDTFKKKDSTLNKTIKSDSLIIDIQPFKGISYSLIQNVKNKLESIISIININPEIDLPYFSYNNLRNRYRADSLINYLSKISATGHVTIGLTSKDISTTKEKIQDWGVMGLGFQPGNACVVSTFRIKKDNLENEFYKVCIHELGHTAGLPHCPIKTCFMRDAEGGYPLNDEIDFCNDCKRYLISHGWHLKI